jgi:hypothetical protein
MKTFDEIRKDPPGTTYIDRIEEGIRFIVMRGPGALCAYVSIVGNIGKILHVENALDQTRQELDLNCHGGVTLEGTSSFLPDGYWYGWDYAHAGDRLMFDIHLETKYGPIGDKEWTPEMVDEDSKEAREQMKEYVKLKLEERNV